MTMIKLKNGSEESLSLVTATLLVLERLLKERADHSAIGGMAFYELVMLCRDRQHVSFGNAGAVLRQVYLVASDGSVHESIRNIVLSATEGLGLGLKLVNPRADELAASSAASAK